MLLTKCSIAKLQIKAKRLFIFIYLLEPNEVLVKKKIAFIVRGNLKDPDKFRSNISKCFHEEFDVYLNFTRRNGHAIDIVEELLEKDHVDYVIGVGGDGTFSEVVNGFMKAPPEIRKKVVLAAYPRGAGNDFARTAGKIQSMQHLYDLVKAGKTRKLDLVKVDYTENNKDCTRYYDNSFDIGLGGLVCKFVNKSGKTWGSNFTYFYNILRSFLTFKRIPIQLNADTFQFSGNVLLASINNGKYFGSGLCVAPDACIDDGIANVLIARRVNIFQFIQQVPNLRKGRKINLKEVFYYKLTTCTIESSKPDCPMELDGEVLGNVPLKIEVIKHAATILKVE